MGPVNSSTPGKLRRHMQSWRGAGKAKCDSITAVPLIRPPDKIETDAMTHDAIPREIA